MAQSSVAAQRRLCIPRFVRCGIIPLEPPLTHTFRTLLALALYTQTDWHRVVDPLHLESPVLSTQTAPEEPLYNTVPEYDTKNMPNIPGLDKTPILATNPAATDPTPTGSSSVVLHTDRIALIMETRANPLLLAVLSHFISNLPAAWPVHLAANQDVFEYVKKSSSMLRYVKSKKLVLTQLPERYQIDSSEKLSQALTDITFYSEFLSPVEWVFLFQTDSIICSASEQSIDDWVDKGYDWVGAPWNPYSLGGNGGLSLRHIPPIIKVLERNSREPNNNLWEDIWLCSHLRNLPDPNLAMTFSVESVYYEHPLGYHLRGSGELYDGNIWHNRTRMNQIFDYCPETKIIFHNLIIDHPDFPKEDDTKTEESKATEESAKQPTLMTALETPDNVPNSEPAPV